MSVNIPEDLYKWIEKKSKENHIDITAQINLLLSKAKKIIEEKNRIYLEYLASKKGKNVDICGKQPPKPAIGQ